MSGARSAATALAVLLTVTAACGVKSVPAPDLSRTLLADGSRVTVSPERKETDGWYPARPSQLWAKPQGDAPARQLTFGSASVADPVVLDDGRVLFVSAMPPSLSVPGTHLALFAVNSDGTGVLPYACQHDGAPWVRQPRELPGGIVAFRASDSPGGKERWESVFSARPFRSRGPLPAALVKEAESSGPRAGKPMGRLSTVDPSMKTGILLCLDARRNSESESPMPVARVRILAGGAGSAKALGEVPLAADGSFLAEVPADLPLGIQALDEQGRVVRELTPWIWVRPGENRACIGCHEPHGMAPRNQRPLAVKAPPVTLALPAALAEERTRGGM